MVGKGADPKSSHIFHQCYVKCCKLQNINPINYVIPSNNGKCVDFCVDRIKYAEWAPILNALSCDLSLHSVSIRCRQQVSTILEHVDCERLAKTVNKRAVILTNFMLSNLVEALAQCLSSSTLLSTLLLEGLPIRIPYLNPLIEAVAANTSLQHLYLPRTLIGDAGCLMICTALKGLPNILTLDLSSCELSAQGAGHIAEVIKYQKIHRYSENWKHTLRYRMPQLDTMSGLRRITLCGNPGLGDRGATVLMDVLADDLWIKALDIQFCGLTEASAVAAGQLLRPNTTLVVLDLRHNADISSESLSKIRAMVRENDRGFSSQKYHWLNSGSSTSCENKGSKALPIRPNTTKDRYARSKSIGRYKYGNKPAGAKKETDYSDALEEQLQEEISHRQQLEELNVQLVDQMKQLKEQQLRLWAHEPLSSGSEHSCQTSNRSYSSSESTSSVPIDHNTLSYIQQAFKDIYTFIKQNQCHGQCMNERVEEQPSENKVEVERVENLRIELAAKKAHSTHVRLADTVKHVSKTTKSACLIGTHKDHRDSNKEITQAHGMFEKQMGDTKDQCRDRLSIMEEMLAAHSKSKSLGQALGRGSCGSTICGSSETLVYSPSGSELTVRPPLNPRDAFYSSSDEDDP